MKPVIEGDRDFMKVREKTHFFTWIQNIIEEVKNYEVDQNLNDSTEKPSRDMIENPFYAEKLEEILFFYQKFTYGAIS